MIVKFLNSIYKRPFVFGLALVAVLGIFLSAYAAPTGISLPTFGPTDDNAQIDYLSNLLLVENEITTCDSSAYHPVSVTCPMGSKVVGGGCYGKGISAIYGCQNNNATSNRTSWDCSCSCSSTALVAQAICAKSP